MAISREKKEALVAELIQLFDTAKAAAGASYSGLSVAEAQELRRQAREAGVTIKVVKNRLVKVALAQTETYKNTETDALAGQLIYAFSEDDEVAPAQILAQFGKKHPAIQLAVGFGEDGSALDATAVKALADLPSKDQLRGMLASTIAAPLTNFLGVANGVQRGFTQVLHQRAEHI